MNTSWPVLKLGDISQSIDYGLTASADFDIKSNRFLRITDLKDGAVVWNDVPGCHCDAKELEKYRLALGDIVFARTGATTGKSYLVSDVYSDAVFASYLIRVKPDPKRIDSCYLAHYFQTPFYWQQIGQNSTGSAQAGVNATKLGALDVAVPPIAEQKRIAAILDKADALRQKRKQSLKLLDEFIRSVFLEMFGDPVVNPMGWEVNTLDELGKITTGSTPPSGLEKMFGGEIPFMTPGDLENGELTPKRFVTDDGAIHSRIVRPGSTLVCCIGATIGKVGIVDTKSAFNQQINAIEWNDKISDIYGYHCLRFFKPIIIARGKSTTLPILKKSLFAKLVIPKPPIKLQSKFSIVVRKAEGLNDKSNASMNELNTLFNSLVQRAFRGEL